MFEYDNYINSHMDVLAALRESGLTLMRDLVLIKPIDDMLEGSFVMTDKHKDNDVYTTFCKGVVQAIGIKVSESIKVGDTVFLSRAHVMREKVKGGYVYLTKERDILGVEE